MKYKFKVVLLILTLFPVNRAYTQAPESKWADVLLKAYHKGALTPVLSIKIDDLNGQTAYKIQKAYVEKRLAKDKIAGFKAGLTSKAGQQKFGVDGPLAGVLFESGKISNNAVIDHSKFNDLRIETEIGFIVGKTIDKPIKDLIELAGYIKAIVPVIELPDLGFEDMEKLKGMDIIAANVASSHFIVGEIKKLDDLVLNSTTVKLVRGNETVNIGMGQDAMGDQWVAAQWLIYMIIQQGWTIEPGSVIITGALGKMIKGTTGIYRADFGDLGVISFEVK